MSTEGNVKRMHEAAHAYFRHRLDRGIFSEAIFRCSFHFLKLASRGGKTNVMLTDDQKKQFMRRAIELSKRNLETGAGGPFGAVVVKKAAIVGEGWNQVTSTNDPTAHAEVAAIRTACLNLNTFDLTGCEIFTSCEPCPMCLSAIYWARIGKIYYANSKFDAAAIDFDDDFIYSELALRAEDRSIPREELLRNEAIKVFDAWTLKPDKVPY